MSHHLSIIDGLFLSLENKQQPMHIAGLCVFELPVDADGDFVARLADKLGSGLIPPCPPFNQIPKHVALWGSWQAYSAFTLSDHFFHIRLKDGSESELMAYISSCHSQPMSRHRPLWEFHLIENICPTSDGSPKRFAVYLKMHHALTDGIGAMRLFRRWLSPDKTATIQTPFWATSPKSQQKSTKPHQKPTAWQMLKQQFDTIRPVAKALWQHRKTREIRTKDTPKSPLNQRIGKARRLSMHCFAKSRFVDVARHFGATTNDVVVAVCGGALQDYLQQQNALPTKPMTAFVPMSLRQDDSSTGNQLSFLLANLATHLDDPIARLHAVKNSILQDKKRFAHMDQPTAINYSAMIYGMAGINLATRLAPTRQAFNLIISNIPADSQPSYLDGAKLVGIYPMSVLFDGQALNITFANHLDKMDLGVTACPDALPNIEILPTLIEKQLALYEQLMADNR